VRTSAPNLDHEVGIARSKNLSRSLTLHRAARPCFEPKEITMARKHTILTALLLSSTPAMASPPPTPPPDSQLSKAQLELRVKLLKAGHDKAHAEIGRFRALCDKDGYPLVGNIANKPNMYQPSQFCADVRKTEKRS
jgi:hypothetical protein